MPSRRVSCFPFAGVALAVVFLAPTRASEPSPRDLIALASVLDSSARDCHSLDIGGWVGGEGDRVPSWNFRTIYCAPNQFVLVVSDAVDDTPLVLGSGSKMLVYDPVGPTVYYSEDAGFTLEMMCKDEKFKFNLIYIMNGSLRPRIALDFPSILSFKSRDGAGFRGEKKGRNEFPNPQTLIRSVPFELPGTAAAAPIQNRVKKGCEQA